MTKHSETSEKALEAYVTKTALSLGGLSLKFSSSTQIGFPDRIVILPGGEHIWVEVKSKGKKPRKIQTLRHDQLRSLGVQCFVVDSREAINNIFEKYKT